MLKTDEILGEGSCWNRAASYERVFVLLGRDESAPAAIRAWVSERIRRGKSKITDPEIVDALHQANMMEHEHSKVLAELAHERELMEEAVAEALAEDRAEIVGGAP